jgi:Co/Zn/Cd efflux system component
MRAAYVHVLADAVTSVLAIVALAAGYYYGLGILDPLCGLVGRRRSLPPGPTA